MKTRKKGNGRTRLNVRLPTELLKWVKSHALENNTTITHLIIMHFTELKMKAETGQVEQF